MSGDKLLRNRIAAVGLLLLMILVSLTISRGQAPPLTPQTVQTGLGSFTTYSPAQLGANAVTLPLNGTTALTNVIDMRGVKQATLIATCSFTGGTVALNFAAYAEDGVTSLIGPGGAWTAIASGTNSFHWSSEQGPQASGGTVGTQIELPQRAMAWSWTQTGGTVGGTCTARLFLQN
jgi:hypothetical protein